MRIRWPTSLLAHVVLLYSPQKRGVSYNMHRLICACVSKYSKKFFLDVRSIVTTQRYTNWSTQANYSLSINIKT